ncbi:MAG: hypothetical protein IPI83_14550 [Sphingomonadales bacterium]|nr:hypothetical protein [Sphingomonadales bacterium]
MRLLTTMLNGPEQSGGRYESCKPCVKVADGYNATIIERI